MLLFFQVQIEKMRMFKERSQHKAAAHTYKLPLVQFLQDTLDTLFGILDESSQRYGLKVFDSLVSKLFSRIRFSSSCHDAVVLEPITEN